MAAVVAVHAEDGRSALGPAPFFDAVSVVSRHARHAHFRDLGHRAAVGPAAVLYKAEAIHRQSWKSPEAVEWATLAWVDGFNPRRLLEPIGDIPPAEAEAAYYRGLAESDKAA